MELGGGKEPLLHQVGGQALGAAIVTGPFSDKAGDQIPIYGPAPAEGSIECVDLDSCCCIPLVETLCGSGSTGSVWSGRTRPLGRQNKGDLTPF